MGSKSPLRKGLTTAALLLCAGATGTLALTAATDATARSRDLVAADLATQAGALGLVASDIADFVVTDVVPTRHNGLTHVYLRQRVNGLEVAGAEMNYSFKRSGEIFTRVGAFVPNVAARAAETQRDPLLSADEAVIAAAAALGLGEVDRLDLVASPGGKERAAVLANPEVSELAIPVRLRYYRLPDSDALRLVWNLSIKVPPGHGSSDWWDLEIDSASGEIVGRANWTADATYSVFPLPQESPLDGPRTDEVDPNDLTASPFGWHDTNGVAGPEFNVTQGNNVTACVDADDTDTCDPGSQPDGTATLDFTGALVPLDLTVDQPADYMPAAVVNLFYWNNIMHDVSYQYGFDEPGGNFQVNTYGNGGAGNDAVNADAQDGSGTNNANFGTPPDGFAPRMQMFRWTAPLGLTLTGTLDASYPAGTASFGATTYNLTAAVELAVDADAATPNDACCGAGNTLCSDPGWDVVSGKIAIVRRGICEFGTKAMNMSNKGALGMIVVNNQGEGTISMGPGANGASVPLTFPVLSVGQSNGDTIIAALPGVNATMNSANTVGPDRDSDLDAGVIAHEYGHGISNRLTGGPANVGCLQNAEQMGEGWSDFFAIVTTAKVADTATTLRPVGAYVSFNIGGIRPFPYTTDNTVNTHTYADLPAAVVPHGVGAIWNAMLWEMYWRLVDAYGFDANFYTGTGGNNLAIQLVIDGMKLQVCSPGFVNGRDAILAADRADTCGVNKCHIWEAFAERGLGASASQGSSNSIADGTAASNLPSGCAANWIFNGDFEDGATCAWSSVQP